MIGRTAAIVAACAAALTGCAGTEQLDHTGEAIPMAKRRAKTGGEKYAKVLVTGCEKGLEALGPLNKVAEHPNSGYAGPHSYLVFHLRQMQAAGWKDVDLDEITALSGASALYGYEQSVDNAFRERLQNRTPVKGLYLSSAWGYPGGGFGGVQYGARQAAFELLSDFG